MYIYLKIVHKMRNHIFTCLNSDDAFTCLNSTFAVRFHSDSGVIVHP